MMRFPYPPALVRAATLWFALSLLSFPLWGQRPPGGNQNTGPNISQIQNTAADVDVCVRDAHGGPLDIPAEVRLYTIDMGYNVMTATGGSSTAHFPSVPPGAYEVEVRCPGYAKAIEHYRQTMNFQTMPIYIYLVREGEAAEKEGAPGGAVMTPQLQGEMEKGLEALRKKQYEAAQKVFAKALQKAPGNPDIIYYLGLAELGLHHTDAAGQHFQQALSLDAKNELALLSLGELQLHSGARAEAIANFEKAVALSHAGWRAHFDLASAYFQARRYSEAESEALRSAPLAKENGGTVAVLLGEIQYSEGKRGEAKLTWESMLKAFPKDPLVPATKKMMANLEKEGPSHTASTTADLPLPRAPEVNFVKIVEHSWAPPDTDSAVYEVARDVNCKSEPILDNALHRMNSDLVNFEKFTATEHIERQEIDRYGWPGPVKTHDFPYIVFVYPHGPDSFYLREFRDGEDDDYSSSGTNNSVIITSTNLNSMGVNVLQPIYRQRFDYSCEGVSNVRGQAAWQIHFVEKRGAKGEGVRRWQLNTDTYEVPVKGRIWISSTSFAVLRVETDLREPVKGLELTKDHLLVDYGPVNFSTGNEQMWLPWSADDYIERRGRRYHHRHALSNYLLFDVETTHKIGKPSEPPATPAGLSP